MARVAQSAPLLALQEEEGARRWRVPSAARILASQVPLEVPPGVSCEQERQAVARDSKERVGEEAGDRAGDGESGNFHPQTVPPLPLL